MWRGSEQLVFIQEMDKVFRCDGAVRIQDAVDVAWIQQQGWRNERPLVKVKDSGPKVGQFILYEYDECTTFSKSSSHGPCALCRLQRNGAWSKRQLDLVAATEKRASQLMQCAKVYALERVSECEW